MAKRKKTAPRYRTMTSIAVLGLAGTLAFAACASAPAGQGSLVDSAQVNIDDARRLSTAAAANLSAVERQSQAATAEANKAFRVTEAAFRMERERDSLAATQTANQQNARATQIVMQATSDALSAAATATAQANALSAQAASMSLNATATAISISQDNAQRASQWEQNVLIPARTLGILALSCMVLFLAFRYGLKAVEALILHIRVVRDGNGNIMVIMPPDGAGRQQMLQPHLSANPVTSFTPAGLAEISVGSHGGDPDVIRRAQAIDALKRAPGTLGGQARPERVDSDGLIVPRQLAAPVNSSFDDPVIRVVAPTQANHLQLTDGQALAAIDSDWRNAHDDV